MTSPTPARRRVRTGITCNDDGWWIVQEITDDAGNGERRLIGTRDDGGQPRPFATEAEATRRAKDANDAVRRILDAAGLPRPVPPPPTKRTRQVGMRKGRRP